MPFYDESGKAIITPKTRTTYQTPTTTTTKKSSRTRGGIKRGKTTTTPTTSTRRHRLEHTQEFEDVGGPPAAKKDLLPLSQEDVIARQRSTLDQNVQEMGGHVSESGKYIVGSSKNIVDLQKQYKGIDPGAQYEYQGGVISGKKAQFILGSQMMDVGKSQFEHMKFICSAGTSLKHQDKSVTDFEKDIMNYPKGTTFTPTPTGYDVIIPETAKLDWAKHHLKQTEELPPGIREINQFAFGAESSIYALAKPIADIFGKGKQFERETSILASSGIHPSLGIFGMAPGVFNLATNPQDVYKEHKISMDKMKYGVHYVSPLDVAFEPIGWSPKGSTEVLTKYPAFLAGGLGGEVAQSVFFTALLKPVGTGIKIGTKAVVKRAPPIYSGLSRTFPKVFSGTLSESGKLIGSKTAQSIHKISGTSFSKNIYGWAAKGMKPGRTLVEHTGIKTFSKGGLKFKTTLFKTDKSVGFWNRRVWMSSDDIIRYNQKLASSGRLDIMFPRADITAGVGKTTGVADVTMWKTKGFFGRKLSRTYGSSILERQVGKRANIPFLKTYDVGKGYGGFSRKISPFIERVGKQDDWFKFVTSHYGTPQQAYLRPGSIISKKWHLVALGEKKLTPSFLKSTRATASFLSKPSLKQTYRTGFSGLGRKASTGGMRMLVPSASSKLLFAVPLLAPGFIKGMHISLSYSPTIKTRQLVRPKTADRSVLTFSPMIKDVFPKVTTSKITTSIQQQIHVPSLESRKQYIYAQFPVSESISYSDTIKISGMKQIQTPVLDTQLRLDLVTDTFSIQDFSLKTPSITIATSTFVPPPPVVPIIPLPRLGGRGITGWGSWGLGKKYRYREFKVTDLKKLLGG